MDRKKPKPKKQKAPVGGSKEADPTEINYQEKWLDNQDLLQMLKISKRSLQNLRAKKLIAYSKVMGKFYYRESDVQKLLHGSICRDE